jgi:putative ABC transport system ATP-binding protein
MTIQLKNIEFSYSNSLQKSVLSVDDWSVASGKKLFIYGPSGCGKSTLLNLVCGIIRPSLGSISVLGQSLNKMSSRELDRFRSNNIGYIFQQFNLINYLSAIENITLASQFSLANKAINIDHKITSLLETLKVNSEDWSRPVNTLSIGQQQRIAIARAFINNPKLLIADEPTSSLDEPSRDNFMSLLTTLCEANKTTLLFVSHDTRLKHHFDLVQKFTDISNAAGKH